MLKFSQPAAAFGIAALAFGVGTGLAQAQGLSNGVPQIAGFRDHGKPVLSYSPEGASPGISNGVPVVTGVEHGKPQITYQPVQGDGADRSFANGGLPDAPGAAGITYTQPAAPSPRLTDVPAAPAAAPPTVARHSMPGAVDAHIAEAKQALKDKRPVAARDQLELAETMLLNARRDGEEGWHRNIQPLADARHAMTRHDDARAASDIASLIARG